MASNPRLRYANVPIEPEVFAPLGIDPAEAGVPDIRAALVRYRRAIDQARAGLGRTLSREELCLIADVMNGTWLIGDWIDTFRLHLVANIQDTEWPEARDGTRASVGYADRWFGAGKGEKAVEGLLRKLRRLPSIEVDALALAVREFWADPEADVHSNWWLPAGHPERAPAVTAGGSS